MELNKRMIRVAVASALTLAVAGEASAQSGIYACGHMRRTRTTAIDKLRASGYTTAILFNVNVEEDGTLTTDYDWENQRPAEAGGIICQGGEYVFGQYQPEYINDIKALLTAPTSINRIEICIGGWGNGSYGKIKQLVEKEGTGPESTLYRNFKALKEAIPEIVAVNNDQEQDYDLEAATAFHKMLAEIGFKTTVAPYMNKDYWKELVAALNETPGTCDIIYLQTYGGGAWNNPSDWKVFGDVPMHIGFDCEASGDIDEMVRKFENWRDNDGVTGGFLWNYNNEARDVNQWATAINRIFPTVVDEVPVATFYSDTNYGGYGIGLAEGEYNEADLAVRGITSKDIESFKVNDGYKVTTFIGDNFMGSKKEWTESNEAMPRVWVNRTRSLKIEATGQGGVDEVNASEGDGLSVGMIPGSETVAVEGGTEGGIEVFNLEGVKVAEAGKGASAVSLAGWPAGVYVVKAGGKAAKVVKP